MAEGYIEFPLTGDSPALAALRQVIGSESEPVQGFRETDGSPGYIRLWDVVDQGLTSPLRREYLEKYLCKLVTICSACHHSIVSPTKLSQIAEQEIEMHIAGAEQATAMHLTANIIQQQMDRGMRNWVDVCTGCGVSFPMHRGAAWKHLVRMKQAAATHKGAVPLTILKYSLTPRELPVSPVQDSPEASETYSLAEGVPETGQGMESRGGRRRKRSHGKRSSRQRDNATVGQNGHRPASTPLG